MFWDPDIGITVEDFLSFRQEWLVERIDGEELDLTPQRFDDKRYCIYALLHRIENNTGLANQDPGRNSWTTSMIPLASEQFAGDYYELIGNWFLVPGSDNNGINTTGVNAHYESDDMNLRLQTILAHVSDVDHNRNEQLLEMDEFSNFTEFIDERTRMIMSQLNEKYLEFMNSNPPI